MSIAAVSKTTCFVLTTTLCVFSLPTVSLQAADQPPARSWHDRSGFFTLEAEIVGIERAENGPKLRLRTADGVVVDVPYALFSDEDQKYAVDWYRAQQNRPAEPEPPKLPVVGDRVQMKHHSRWWKGEIVEIDGERFRFRYDGYSATWDEWKTAEQLRWEDGTPVIPGGPADPQYKSDAQQPAQKKVASADASGGANSIDLAVDSMNKKPDTRKTSPSAPGRLPMVGDRVKIKWGSSWWKGEIVEIDGERFRFNYDGWDSSPDEWKTAEQLRWEDDTPVIPGGPSDSGKAESVAARPSAGPAKSGPAKIAPAKSAVADRVSSDAKAPSDDAAMDLSRLESSTETTSVFPKGLSPDETYAYLRKEATRGNLQVFWDWMPDDLRAYVVSQEQRDNLRLLDQVNPKGLGTDHFLTELVTVLRNQKTFVLQNPVILSILEDQETVDACAEIYEPATNLLDEFTQLIGNIDKELRGSDFDRDFRRRCDRIGKHVAILVAAAPEDQLQAFWDRMIVNADRDGGTLTMVYPTGAKKVFPLVRINGRWMPKPLVESLLSIPDAQRANAEEIELLSKSRLEGRIMGAGMARGFKDANYMSLAEKLQATANAKTQVEFDAAFQQVLVALQVGGFLGG